ncbi:protein of unknown function (DUF4276) [Cyclonatronum proteinivorum]|uniref:DUF4276 family protein n=1 Tax=Cyclonatronum proteinivorum TaxID=1457365 RepID=A0A345UPL6_9BACT|nr:DUF4276 family protein [Cyclonatronum proteinivorum]AXJ02418.1 protein of unknown function (DUF4276) [Cyclonatronum proteinivorum]
MKRVIIFCEGQTEETFVRTVLAPHFQGLSIWIYPVLLKTSSSGRGGVVTYGKIKRQLIRKCKEDPSAWITTMIDFYGLPQDFPIFERFQQLADTINAAEAAFEQDIAAPNLIANIIVHEFEGLLFSSPDAFAVFTDAPEIPAQIQKIRQQFDTPEEIDGGHATAPSKRILQLWRGYDKVLFGSLIALEAGLETIRAACPHFNRWITKLENL